MRHKEETPVVPFAKLKRGEMLIGRVERWSDGGSYGRGFAIVPALVGKKGAMQESLEMWIGENTSLMRFKLTEESGNLVAIVCEGLVPTVKGEMRRYRLALLDSLDEVEALAGQKLSAELRASFDIGGAPARKATDPQAPLDALEGDEDDLPF